MVVPGQIPLICALQLPSPRVFRKMIALKDCPARNRAETKKRPSTKGHARHSWPMPGTSSIRNGTRLKTVLTEGAARSGSKSRRTRMARSSRRLYKQRRLYKGGSDGAVDVCQGPDH